MIIVDTSVWSVAFRRRRLPDDEMTGAEKLLRRLTREKEHLGVPGVVLQELLSGIKDPAQAERIKVLMEGYPLLPATKEHHVEAANIYNACRKAGVAAAAIDCLIAAQCVLQGGLLLTLDDVFKRISICSGLRLYPIWVD